MTKQELIQKMIEGEKVSLTFSEPQSDGNCEWNNEEWSYNEAFIAPFGCNYDGIDGSTTRHTLEDMKHAFNPEDAEEIEII
jgi:hypothetical protein